MDGSFSVIEDVLYLSDAETFKNSNENSFHSFFTEQEYSYIPFCDDFGPMNLDQIYKFSEMINEKREAHPDQKLVYCVENGPRNLTNAVFLLGSYLIITQQMRPDSVWKVFKNLEPQMEMYRDATFSEDPFRLNLIDCWSGFARARSLGWIDMIDLDEYIHYDNPLEGDLHWIVPDKLIAFKGPHSLSNARLFHDTHGYRVFSPTFYTDGPFTDMGVSTVVRLNELEYAPAEFEACGIRCVDLEFDDCSVPPTHVIAEFLHTVDFARGAVAVHCKAGLGRTGTLIAIYMMRTHGFTAREAMGWLRIVRPGSVIGDQQEFLCHMEEAHCDAAAAAAAFLAAAPRRRGRGSLDPAFAREEFTGRDVAVAAERARELAEQVAAALRSPERTASRARLAGC